MKKSLLIVAFAFALVFAFAAAAMAYGPIYGGGGTAAPYYNPDYPGYLSWESIPTSNTELSPHGNYTTSTNKCAVCHAVHRADGTGVALTAWGGVGTTPGMATGSTLAPFESCFFCHGNSATFTDKTVEFAVAANGTLSPHTTCGRCHTASPHGSGVSEYPILAAKLVNTKADYQLDYDLAMGNNGLVPAMFDLSDPALYDQGLALATGYLCVGCHGSATDQHVFAVNESGATPALHYTDNPVEAGYHAAPGDVTGHRVWAAATDTWNLDGSKGTWYSGGGEHDYYLAWYQYDGVWYAVMPADATGPAGLFEVLDPAGAQAHDAATKRASVGTTPFTGPWTSTVAFNDALGCGACHDAKRADGKLAFPHGYVDAAGAPAPKGVNTGASFLWMTVAENAGAEKTLLSDTGANQAFDATKDGACLKCHVSADGLAGVGITY